jgi:hypothetical protein
MSALPQQFPAGLVRSDGRRRGEQQDEQGEDAAQATPCCLNQARQRFQPSAAASGR